MGGGYIDGDPVGVDFSTWKISGFKFSRFNCSYYFCHGSYVYAVTVCFFQDLDMYCEETDTPAMARTSNLNEELGQVCSRESAVPL